MPKSELQRRVSSERMKRLWADPEFRARRSALSRETMARLQGDPDFKAAQIAGMTETRRRPENRRKASELRTAFWSDPARREEASDRQRARMADPAVRAEFAGYCLRGMMERCGFFWLPPHLKVRYRKLKAALGFERAREAIRAELRDAAHAAAPRFDDIPNPDIDR